MINNNLFVDRLKELRPSIDVTNIDNWSHKQWLDYRLTGLGCSEIGSIIGLNKWQEPSIVFAQKIGIIPTGTTDSQPMFFGREFEAHILDLWQYYDPNEGSWESVKDNKEKGEKVRTAAKIEVYARNPTYPWLFGGCDGFFTHNGELAILEVKTISGFSADQYESGMPPSYIFQIHAYMMLFDCKYAEIAMLKDGNNFQVFPFDRNDEICEIIYSRGEEFWDNIQNAKKAMLVDEDWLQYEPEPSDSEIYEKFLLERFRANNGLAVSADKEVSDKIKEYVDLKKVDKELSVKIRGISNSVKYFMGDATELSDLEEGYSCSWRKGKDDSRRLIIKYKEPK